MAGRVTPLKLAILEAGVTQKSVAEKAGMSETRLSHIARGLHPSNDEAVALADAIGRTVDELWPPTGAEAAA
jgi:transcriptional regulator with XRE-family HTH domain